MCARKQRLLYSVAYTTTFPVIVNRVKRGGREPPTLTRLVWYYHWLINYIDTKAKCRHLKKLTCKGTLWQVFIRVYKLEIQSVILVFRPLFGSPVPPSHLPCVNKYTVYMYTVCKGGGVWGFGLRQINTCRKVPLQVKSFRWQHFALVSTNTI